MQNPKGCWLQCTVAALAFFCALGLNVNAFSVYMPYLVELLELTPNQSSGFLLIRGLLSAAAVYLARYYYEKLEIRLGYTLVLVMSAAALAIYACASGFVGLCIAAAISGISCGLGSMYPVAILIHRWFSRHEGLAMGICASSSGLAITVGAPILTHIIETRSMLTAMYAELGFMVLCAAVCLLLLRNLPDGVQHFTAKFKETRHPFRLNTLFFAIVGLGVMGEAVSFVTVHYSFEQFDPYMIAAVVAVAGALLIGAKFLLGQLLDVWGGHRTNRLFFAAAIAGCLLFCLGGMAGMVPAFAAASLYGIGLSVQTVGVSVYARDLSSPEDYEATQQQFQFASLLGAPVCTLFAGQAATFTGNYRGFFLIVAGVTAFSAVVIQRAYRRVRR